MAHYYKAILAALTKPAMTPEYFDSPYFFVAIT